MEKMQKIVFEKEISVLKFSGLANIFMKYILITVEVKLYFNKYKYLLASKLEYIDCKKYLFVSSFTASMLH